MTLDPKLLEILACPEDKGPLLWFPDELHRTIVGIHVQKLYFRIFSSNASCYFSPKDTSLHDVCFIY